MRKQLVKIRFILLAFILGLILSGITAFPLRSEMEFLNSHKELFPPILEQWISQVNAAIASTPDLVLYGTDWLAFAHVVIALFFIPVYLDPVKYKANILIGMVACLLVFPLAFICGPVRGIPFFHQLIDCCFGLFGGLLLYILYFKITRLQSSNNE